MPSSNSGWLGPANGSAGSRSFHRLYKCRSIWISLLPLSIYEIFDNLSCKIRVLYILKLAYYREMGGVS